MTDAAIIYRSHVEAIEALPEDQQLEAYKAIIAYCMDDEIPEAGLTCAIVKMAAPVLDSWKKKREAGQKGGNVKQSESTTEANGSTSEAERKQTEASGSKSEPKEKVKGKVKEKEKEKSEKEKKNPHGEYRHVTLTPSEEQKLIEEFGETKTNEAIRILDEYMEQSGKKYKSCYLAMRQWALGAVDERKNKASPRRTGFNNFDGRTVDFENLERKLLARG